MKRLQILLQLDLSEQAPNGPGWYIQSRVDDAEKFLINPTEITPGQAYGVAEVLGSILQTTDSPPQHPPVDIVRSGNSLIEQTLRQQLDEAQKWVSQIGLLKEKLSKFAPQQDEKSASLPGL